MHRLPPIETRWTPNLPKGAFLNRGFTFQSPAWRRCGFQMRLLTKAGPRLITQAVGRCCCKRRHLHFDRLESRCLATGELAEDMDW